MSNKIINLNAVVLISLITLILTVAGYADLGYKPGELLVRFASKPDGKQRTMAERNAVLAAIGGGTIKRSYKLVPGLTLVKLPENRTVENALPIFNNTDGILDAEPNYRIKVLSTFPNDPNFSQLWGMHNTGQTGGRYDADIDAPEAWDLTTGSSDIIVAVIDTGIDYNHPDLAANMWVNPGEISGNGIDDDDNGFVDDIYGYDFINDDNDPNDDHSHGTHCAGIIGALGNNEQGVTGVCWNVKIMALKFLAYTGSGNDADAIACIEYAVDKGAKILSNSWGGGGGSPYLKSEIIAAGEQGVLFVAAAGNSGSNFAEAPAGFDCDNIISVMATDANDERSVWSPTKSSSYGRESVDLAAPGSDIFSTMPTYVTDAMASYNRSTYYEWGSGTSAATPFVAGACALVWSANPALGYLEVKDILMDTVDEVYALDGLCVTEGRLNIHKATISAAKCEGIITKTDDVNAGNSVLPGDYITYTISYGNLVTDPCDPNYLGDINDVNIVDYLPDEIDATDVNFSEPNGSYDMLENTVTWEIGTLSPGDANSVTVTVRVNELAEPNGTITNVCALYANEIIPRTAVEITDVNWWSPDIIYVDRWAYGANTGMSWDNADPNLQRAFENAQNWDCNEIWVVAGTYYTHTEPGSQYWDVTFELLDGMAVYGGFAGTETSRSQRNWITNETILEGDIDNDGTSDTNYLVTASNVNSTAIIDGFIIRNGYYAGIKIDGGSPTISHNKITENVQRGIECINQSSANISGCDILNNGSKGINCNASRPDITYCLIKGNDDGIYCYLNSEPNIINCIIEGNRDDGICCYNILSTSVINIKNNWIHNNGTDGSGNGIYLSGSLHLDAVVISNNTIANNTRYGIETNDYPSIITNCIIWGNGAGSLQWYNYNVTYSCIQGDPVYNGEENINDDPCFVNDPEDPNNFHLDANSLCIDAGDPAFDPDPNETDIDSESRIVNNRVDMGADEYYWSPADFNGDGVVNFLDYALLANAWQTGSGDPNYNEICDLAGNNSIDSNDLARFTGEWLWQAGWTKTFPCGMGRGSGFNEGLYQTVSAEQQQSQVDQFGVEEVDIEQIIKWLEEFWLADEDFRKTISEDEWLKLLEMIKEMWN